MPGPSDMEIQILLKLKAQLDDLIKVKNGTKGLGDEFKQVNVKSGNFFRNTQSGLRNLLSPIIMVRRTLFTLGAAWGLTAGTIIAAIVDVNKKLQELNDLSMKTSFSTEEISKQLYGFNIATNTAKVGTQALTEAQSWLGRTWALATTKVAEYIGQIKIAGKEEEIYQNILRERGYSTTFSGSVPMGQIVTITTPGKKATNEEDASIRALARVQALQQVEKDRWDFNSTQTKEAILLRGDFKAKILQSQGQELQAFRESMNAQRRVYVDMYGPNGDIVKLFDEFYTMQEAKIQMQTLGIKEQWQNMREFAQDAIGAMRNSFQGFFSDVFQGKLKTAREYFYNFLQDMLSAWAKAMAQMAVTSMMTTSGGGLSWLGKIFGGIAGVAAGGGTLAAAGSVLGENIGSWGSSSPLVAVPGPQGSSIIGTPTYHARGGWAGMNGPEVSVLGENGPELVLNQNQLSRVGSQNNVTNINYYINAVDPRSFSDLVLSNPNAIVAVTSRAISQNTGFRKTIKEKR